jgi:hypothetical protein
VCSLISKDSVVYSCVIAFWIILIGFAVIGINVWGMGLPNGIVLRMLIPFIGIMMGLYFSLFAYWRTRNLSLKGQVYLIFLTALFTGIVSGVGIMMNILPLAVILAVLGIPISLGAWMQIYFGQLGVIMVILGIVLALIQIVFVREVANKTNRSKDS